MFNPHFGIWQTPNGCFLEENGPCRPCISIFPPRIGHHHLDFSGTGTMAHGGGDPGPWRVMWQWMSVLLVFLFEK